MSGTKKATKIAFWLTFGAFLSMSVPHVAWVFRFYEPHNDGLDLIWWSISYGVAISIDALICWLSYTCSEQNEGKRDGLIIWAFILLLAILSWYCNWIFSETMRGINVWSLSLPNGWTIGDITPLIVSAIPMFMIAYTYMSRRILGTKSHVKSAKELQEEAQELAAIVAAKQEINALKNQQFSMWFAGKKQVLVQAFSQPNALQIVPELPTEDMPIVEEIVTANEEEVTPLLTEDVPVEPAQESVRPIKYFMDFEEASRYTGYAISTLRKQLKSGEIEANKTGEKLKVSSLKIRTGITAKMPAITIEHVPATNGQH